MTNIIVAFPRIENGKSIKNILVKHGFHVSAVCTTGAQALQHADMLEEGVVVCASRLLDMVYGQLREYLPAGFEMLVVSSPGYWEGQGMGQVLCLPMPLKVHELAAAVEQLAGVVECRRKKRKLARRGKRDAEGDRLLLAAKEALMAKKQISEEEAHRYIQKSSMDSGRGLVETARMVLSMMQEGEP